MLRNLANQRQQILGVFIITPVIVLVMALLFFAIHARLQPLDDIPWAQGTVAPLVSIRFTDRVIQSLPVLVVTIIVQLLLLGLAGLLNVYNAAQVMGFTILSVLLGLLVAFSPLGEAWIWRIVVRLHLKQSDLYLDVLLTVLRSGVLMAVGAGSGSVLLGLCALKRHLKL